jgi:shikimate dehydrogenase
MTDKPDGGPKACIIGWPAGHSRSPLIHRFWLDNLHISGSYERAAVAPEAFADFIRDLAGNGFIGANVTLPHKQKAFELCDVATAAAAKLQAVNTLWLENGKLCGDNTDVAGFLGALDEDAPGWDKRLRKAVVLGAGGAARAILHGLQLRGAERIVLVNRTKARADEVAALAGQVSGQAIEVADFADPRGVLAGADLLVNTTSLGMKGQPSLDIDLEPLPMVAIVCDIVYVPLETALLQQARAGGRRTVSGVGMLLHQAAPGFARWFGATPRVTAELRALVEADVLRSL